MAPDDVPAPGSAAWRAWRRDTDLDAYDARWREIEASGQNPHGEADLVMSYDPEAVLDAGCGTGRVAIELARRGVHVVGVDLDPDMLGRARAKAPELTWVLAGLDALDLPDRFDLVLLAGNVLPYVEAAARPAAVAACARQLRPGGRLVSGSSLRRGWPSTDDLDGWAAAAGLRLETRAGSWTGDPFTGDDYAVSVHRLGPTPPSPGA